MKILSFDTSNNLASVAVMDNNELLAYEITNENSQQAEKLFKLIEKTLSIAELKLADIDLISVTNGPGSFTGVRIGLAAALGIKTGFNGKIIALTNFQVLAWHAKQICADKPIAVIIDARRDQVYFQLFNQQLETITEPALVDVREVILPKNITLVGDGVKYLSQDQIDNSNNTNAKMLASASNYYLQSKLYHDLIALYIRQPDATKPT